MNPSSRILMLTFFMTILSCSTLPVKAGGSKLYVVTDREKYAAGETIQFQVFLLYPSLQTNNTVFVELLDCKGNNLGGMVLPGSQYTAFGSISLPDSIVGDFVLLYCYVTGEGNNVESYVTKKLFRNGTLPGSWEPTGDLQISLACEGNTFVAECPNRVLLRCTNAQGGPVHVRGKLVNQKDEVLSDLETNDEGYVRLLFSPEQDNSYFIIVYDEKGTATKAPFPPVASSGVTLKVSVSDTTFDYSAFSYTENDHELAYTLGVFHNNDTVYKAAFNFEKGLSIIKESISFRSLPKGFLCFRVFSPAGKTAVQRMVYNDAGKQGNVIRVIDTVNRKEARIDLPGYVSGTGYLNIISTKPGISNSDGTGDLPQQSGLAYLNNDPGETLSFNDRLIFLKDAPADHYMLKDTFNRFISLEGIVYDYEKKPVKNKPVTLVILQKNFKKSFVPTFTDKAGRIKLNNLVFFDSVSVYYQLGDKSDEKNSISLEFSVSPVRSERFAKWLIPYLSCSPNSASVQASLHDTPRPADSSWTKFVPGIKTLREVTVTGTRSLKKTDSELFKENNVSAQNNSSNFMRNEFDFIANPVLIDNTPLFVFLRSRVSGIRVHMDSKGTPSVVSTAGGYVGIYLDDMLIDPDDEDAAASLAWMTVAEVSLVRYYSMSVRPKPMPKKSQMGSGASSGGDLMIYTRRGYIPSSAAVKGMSKTMVAGYDREYLPGPVTTPRGSSLYWKANFEPKKESIIYMQLPEKTGNTNIRIIIEGVNTQMAPYRFMQDLVFM